MSDNDKGVEALSKEFREKARPTFDELRARLHAHDKPCPDCGAMLSGSYCDHCKMFIHWGKP